MSDNAVETLQDKINRCTERAAYFKLQNNATEEQRFLRHLENYKKQLDDSEKKNSQLTQQPSATGNERSATNGTSIDSLIASCNDSNMPNMVNIEAVEEDAYFFTSEEAAKEFQYYNRSRLRSKLFAWEYGKRKKNKHTKDETLAMCAFFIAQINGIIDCYAKPEYAEILRKRVYSLGKKDDAKTYCFDIKKLKKDFDF